MKARSGSAGKGAGIFSRIKKREGKENLGMAGGTQG